MITPEEYKKMDWLPKQDEVRKEAIAEFERAFEMLEHYDVKFIVEHKSTDNGEFVVMKLFTQMPFGKRIYKMYSILQKNETGK